MTGYREALLEYRKSLPNSWDYNAYVGILLGVGGSKHGDAACTNFAIGQGDNGNNTKKTLEAKSLISVFEKYKGKKVGASILLSDMEDEIVSIAPEYVSIRQKFHEIVFQNRSVAEKAQKVDSNVFNVPSVKKVVGEKKNKQESEAVNVLKYLHMPSHDVYYTFPGCRKLEYGEARKDPGGVELTSKPVVQEQDGKLYYVGNIDEAFPKIYELPIYGSYDSASEKTLLRLYRTSRLRCYLEKQELSGDIFHLGTMPRFCLYKKKLYFSSPQMEGPKASNSISSYHRSGNDIYIDYIFELNDPKQEKKLYSPYVLGNSTLATVCSEHGNGNTSIHLVNKNGAAKSIYQGGGEYLAINEQECIVDKDTDTAVYNFVTGQKTSIAKTYKGAKGKDRLFINSQKDILYYFEQENNPCGKIIGISKSGEIVDEWKPITDKKLVNRVKRASGYSSFSFNGDLRVFKISAKLKSVDGKMWYEDCIYTADRNGNVENRFLYRYDNVGQRVFNTSLHIQTLNTIIVHVDIDTIPTAEAMITTKDEHNFKPL